MTAEEEPDRPVKGGRGVAPGSRFTLNPAGSEPLHVRHAPRSTAEPFEARIVADLPYVAFSYCPICLRPSPASKEHVPQETLGGKIRTLTCTDCNNRLGSRLEGALADWCFDTFRHTQATGDPVPGRRRIPSLMLRSTPEGKFVLIADRPDPALRDILNSGEMSLSFEPPNRNRYRLAALKHAYLAACLRLKRIPTGRAADQIRADLLAVRDAPDTASIPVSDLAAQLPLLRSYAPPAGPAVGLAIGRPRQPPDGPWTYFVSLAGVILVGWPLSDAPPVAAE